MVLETNNLLAHDSTDNTEPNVQRIQSQGTLLPEQTSPLRRSRSASGSFRGAYESEEEIHFAGLSRSRRSQRSNASSMSEFQPFNLPPGAGNSPEEEKMKRKLKFFFMNPKDKYIATKQIPWKLLLQILKVALVTTQLVIFAEYRYAHVDYYTDQTVTFEHFFIKDWDQVREVHAYPPPTGRLALYSKKDFYEFVDFAIGTFARIEEDALEPIFKNSSFLLCIDEFTHVNISNRLMATLDMRLKTTCLELNEDAQKRFNNTKEWFKDSNFNMNWFATERIRIQFNLTTIAFQPLGPEPTPDCFQFQVKIDLENGKHDGQMPISLFNAPVRLECPGQVETVSTAYTTFVVLLNLVVIFTSIASLILCVRALLRAQLLKHEADIFFKQCYDWSLTVNEKLEFLNLWYVMICINDILIISGSIIKQLIESKSLIEDMWDMCSLLLGTGNLLVWFGLLRYLGFFKTYNVLILTMKGAAPNMMRFLICASFIYIGFVFAGWVILGPYHFKFETIMSTSECLFSLINGDDMFATFKSIPKDRAFSVWVYSRIYLYTFICLFIYVVLSLFISIIMDTYEIIKNCYERGFPADRMEQFYCTSRFDFNNGQYQGESVFTRVWTLVTTRIPSRSGYEEI